MNIPPSLTIPGRLWRLLTRYYMELRDRPLWQTLPSFTKAPQGSCIVLKNDRVTQNNVVENLHHNETD
jgi:hypothetical protein